VPIESWLVLVIVTSCKYQTRIDYRNVDSRAGRFHLSYPHTQLSIWEDVVDFMSTVFNVKVVMLNSSLLNGTASVTFAILKNGSRVVDDVVALTWERSMTEYMSHFGPGVTFVYSSPRASYVSFESLPTQPALIMLLAMVFAFIYTIWFVSRKKTQNPLKDAKSIVSLLTVVSTIYSISFFTAIGIPSSELCAVKACITWVGLYLLQV
jgi:hypothetical protein